MGERGRAILYEDLGLMDYREVWDYFVGFLPFSGSSDLNMPFTVMHFSVSIK